MCTAAPTHTRKAGTEAKNLHRPAPGAQRHVPNFLLPCDAHRRPRIHASFACFPRPALLADTGTPWPCSHLTDTLVHTHATPHVPHPSDDLAHTPAVLNVRAAGSSSRHTGPAAPRLPHLPTRTLLFSSQPNTPGCLVDPQQRTLTWDLFPMQPRSPSSVSRLDAKRQAPSGVAVAGSFTSGYP